MKCFQSAIFANRQAINPRTGAAPHRQWRDFAVGGQSDQMTRGRIERSADVRGSFGVECNGEDDSVGLNCQRLIDRAGGIESDEIIAADSIHLTELAADQDLSGMIHTERVNRALNLGGKRGVEFSRVVVRNCGERDDQGKEADG